MNKNAFRVFSDEVKILLILLIISVSGYIWVYTSPTVYNRDNVYVFLLLTIMLVVLPIILFIWSFYTKWPKIVLTNIGINKILLDKEQISINWNNVKDIKKIKSSWAVWVFISSSKMESNSMRKLKKRKDIIYFYESDETKKIFLSNIPKNIKDMYESTFINRAEL